MSILLAIGFALLVLNTFFGVVANGFIVLFICINWFRSKKLSPTDLILCCLGLLRFSWQMVLTFNSIFISFFRITYFQNYMLFSPIMTMWFFINSVNLWFAAWLSVLYFVKVTIFSHPVILQMKQRYSGLVPWLLLGSVVFSAVVTIIIVILSPYVFSNFGLCQSLSCNTSYSTVLTLNCFMYIGILHNAFNIIPFVLFLSSSIFLISSLGKHLRHMQYNGIGIKDLNTQVHLTAIKVLASFTVLYLTSFIAVAVQAALPLTSERHWTNTVYENLSAMYPFGHAIILISVNPKLKEGCIRMLCHFKCCLSEALL